MTWAQLMSLLSKVNFKEAFYRLSFYHRLSIYLLLWALLLGGSLDLLMNQNEPRSRGVSLIVGFLVLVCLRKFPALVFMVLRFFPHIVIVIFGLALLRHWDSFNWLQQVSGIIYIILALHAVPATHRMTALSGVNDI